jgi:hypothetical protein
LGDIAMLFYADAQKSHCLRVFAEASEAAEEIVESGARSRVLNMLALRSLT